MPDMDLQIASASLGWATQYLPPGRCEAGWPRTVARPRLIGRTPTSSDAPRPRNLIRAGVPQHVGMQFGGWKTDGMFRRYAIVERKSGQSADQDDYLNGIRAAAKLFDNVKGRGLVLSSYLISAPSEHLSGATLH